MILLTPLSTCSGCEVLRAATIGARERPRCGHRMNEVVGGRDAREGLVQRVGLKDVPADDLCLRSRPSRQRLGSSHHAAHRSPRLLELPQQPAPDVAGRPGEQNAPRRLLVPRRVSTRPLTLRNCGTVDHEVLSLLSRATWPRNAAGKEQRPCLRPPPESREPEGSAGMRRSWPRDDVGKSAVQRPYQTR